MNVISAKHYQFSSPIILYLPGHEENKYAHKASGERHQVGANIASNTEPELWKIYRRLSQSRRAVRGPTGGTLPAAFDIPGKGGMKCMCYENLMKLIKEQACIHPPQLFRCSNKNATIHKCSSVFPSWTKRALLGFRCNEELQFPLSTLIVRWQLKRNIPSYDQKSLRSIFSKYGKLRDIRQLSPNSCVVIFDDLESACYVMQSRNIGEPANRLNCRWWHQSMTSKVVRSTTKGVQVKTDFYKL